MPVGASTSHAGAGTSIGERRGRSWRPFLGRALARSDTAAPALRKQQRAEAAADARIELRRRAPAGNRERSGPGCLRNRARLVQTRSLVAVRAGSEVVTVRPVRGDGGRSDGDGVLVRRIARSPVAEGHLVVVAAALVAVRLARVAVAVAPLVAFRLVPVVAHLVIAAGVAAEAAVVAVVVGVAARRTIRDAAVALAVGPLTAAAVFAVLADLVVAAPIAAGAAVVAVRSRR